ncbi:MAG TPA: M56 family metallopeptidase [Puia sp.]|nr:M56 family metallopeptidase [Puia sp.]
MIPYILHVTVITTICFLFYKLLLQKETFYRLNRWTLMACLAVSFTLPLLPVPRDWSWRISWAAKAVQPVTPPVIAMVEPVQGMVVKSQDVAVTTVAKRDEVKTQELAGETAARPVKPKKKHRAVAVVSPGNVPVSVPSRVQEGSQVSGAAAITPVAGKGITLMDRVAVVLQWLFYLYLFGVLVFGGNFLLQMGVLLYQSYARPVIRDGRFRIVEINGNRAPCSFGNTIFINPALYDWETYNQILIHEKVHVSGRHTLDILLAETALVWQWFNPFAWLYRREVENNLEFLTDASVLEHLEVERSAYQLSLLRVSAPHLPFSITNNYNQSLLKRRIVMMNSKRSSTHTVWKYFFLIPLLTGLVCALNKPVTYGAGTKNGPLRVSGRMRIGSMGMSPVGAWADTGKKPHTDTSRPGHRESRAGEESPVTRIGTDGGDWEVQSDVNPGLNLNLNLNEQMRQAQLAQADMAQQALVLNKPQVQLDLSMISAQANANLKLAMQANLALDISGDMRIAGDTDILEGAWFATSFSTDDKLRFELKRESENGSWNNSFSVDKTEFNPYPGQGNVEFKLTREAGTITFKGQFDGQEGFGHFRFAPDEAYFNALKQMGLDDIEGRRFAYFTVNLKKEYAAMIMRSYPHLSSHELIGFAANKIDQDYIKYWQGAGITDLDNPRTLISLKSQHIDRAYVDELKAAGYDHLQWRELVSLKSQHIDGAYIRSLGRGKDNEPISVRELVSYKAMHIDSGYIASLRSVGYAGLDRNQLFSMYSQHVSADFIKGFQDIGYKDLSARDLVGLKAMNITPDFVREFNKIGFDHIPVNMLGMLKSTGVNAEYVSKMKEKGFVSKDLGKYIRLKNDFN